MTVKGKNSGSVILMAVFAIALFSTLAIGILQMNTGEIQLVQNQIYAAQAIVIAEAGLNDAFAQIRVDDEWNDGFSNKSFTGGTYTVNVTGTLPNLTITSTSNTSLGFAAEIEADVTVSINSPYIIRIDELRVNE